MTPHNRIALTLNTASKSSTGKYQRQIDDLKTEYFFNVYEGMLVFGVNLNLMAGRTMKLAHTCGNSLPALLTHHPTCCGTTICHKRRKEHVQLLSRGVTVAKHVFPWHMSSSEANLDLFGHIFNVILTSNEQDHMCCVSLENLHLLSASNSVAYKVAQIEKTVLRYLVFDNTHLVKR